MDLVWKFLTYRSRSEKELKDYLRKKRFSDDTIRTVIKRVKEMGYVNDTKFARDWANYRKNQGKGSELIKMELRSKGIENDVISEIVSSSYKSREEELKQIEEIAVRKMKKMGDIPPEKLYNRLIGFLTRRGFPVDKIIQVVQSLRKNADFE